MFIFLLMSPANAGSLAEYLCANAPVELEACKNPPAAAPAPEAPASVQPMPRAPLPVLPPPTRPKDPLVLMTSRELELRQFACQVGSTLATADVLTVRNNVPTPFSITLDGERVTVINRDGRLQSVIRADTEKEVTVLLPGQTCRMEAPFKGGGTRTTWHAQVQKLYEKSLPGDWIVEYHQDAAGRWIPGNRVVYSERLYPGRTAQTTLHPQNKFWDVSSRKYDW